MKGFIVLLAVVAVCAAGKIKHHQARSSSSSSSDSDSNESQAVTYEDLMGNPKNYEKDLKTDGVWVQWDSSQIRLPGNAVIAGFDSNNGVSYVIRAPHTQSSGAYVGKVIGKFLPLSKGAWISFGGTEVEKKTFELLVHNRYMWGTKTDQQPLIEGGDDQYICRLQHNGDNWTPGKLDLQMKRCTVGFRMAEIVSPDYQVLRRMC